MKGQGGKKGKKEKGITLAGSDSWMPAKIKKEGGEKTKQKEEERSFTQLTFKRKGSKGTQRKTDRQTAENNAYRRGQEGEGHV